jgi:AcrR family transcriptional regulator
VSTKEQIVEEYREKSILEAAIRVISREGPAGATMQDIADEARIAKGTIYLYFKNREDLVQRTADFVVSELLSRVEAIFADPRPLAHTLRALVTLQLTFFDERRDFFRAYLSVACHGDAQAGARQAKRQAKPQYVRYLDRFSAYLKERIARGELMVGNPDRLALFVSEGVNGVVHRRLTEPAPPAVAADVDWIVPVLLHGVSAVGGRA